ncbi:hypothetical protein KQX54_014207 [Cotesia glomerata]|uniref:Uncharacterized protein n=1 Tax=Cotesia glomerata TaxID=32391 RepID=A0AAV7IL22_COTGL|nr:hypothetical protein KQX54_014207 [Cotesia glomerata]
MLILEMSVVFGIYGKTFGIYEGKKLVGENLLDLDGKTILVSKKTSPVENPKGRSAVGRGQLKKKIEEIFGDQVEVPEVEALDGTLLQL